MSNSFDNELALTWISSGFHSGRSVLRSCDIPCRGVRSSMHTSKCKLL